MKIKRFGLAMGCIFLIINLVGCEAFVRKFTRKPKESEIRKEEMVLAPEEYKGPQMSKEELYRKQLVYWQSWQEEVVTALLDNASYKKRVSCVNYSIKHLKEAQGMLKGSKREQFDVYMKRMLDLQVAIIDDAHGYHLSRDRITAERLKMDILRYFSYKDVKDFLT